MGRCDRHENADSGTSPPGLGALLQGFTETPHIQSLRWEPTGQGPGRSRRWEWGDAGARLGWGRQTGGGSSLGAEGRRLPSLSKG